MTESIRILVLLVQVTAAMLLVRAGTSKIADPAPIRRTIAALDIPWESVLAPVLGSCEAVAGVGLVLLPGHWIPALLIAVLACAFGASAALAIIKRLYVECGCFGSSESARLGWRQLALLPLWLAVAASVVAAPEALPNDRPALISGAFVLLSLRALGQLIHLQVEHRAQRVAIDGS